MLASLCSFQIQSKLELLVAAVDSATYSAATATATAATTAAAITATTTAITAAGLTVVKPKIDVI